MLMLLMVPFTLFALQINESLLQVHATLFPKTILMDYQFEKKLHEGAITIAILYEEGDYRYAVKLQEMVEAKYRQGVKNIPVRVLLSSYDRLQKKAPAATAYYLFPASDSSIKAAVALANNHSSLSFVYDENDLMMGAMISVKITDKVKPYINVDALKDEGISLRPILLNISELFFQPHSAVLENTFDQYSLYNV